MPVEQIMQLINQAVGLYYRLILVVAPAGRGKTRLLQEVHKLTGAPLLNVNLELSRRLLDLTERQRALRLSRLLSDIVNAPQNDVILLDNTEILFDAALKQDPLRLLQGLSRNKTIVAAWNGCLENGYLTFAKPNHHEYRRYPVRDFLVAGPEPSTGIQECRNEQYYLDPA
ncbi:MAG: BREX-3 system P-loop-containing protein BrxF [Bacillota bacterium]